jgi:hypothetical protein
MIGLYNLAALHKRKRIIKHEELHDHNCNLLLFIACKKKEIIYHFLLHNLASSPLYLQG